MSKILEKQNSRNRTTKAAVFINSVLNFNIMCVYTVHCHNAVKFAYGPTLQKGEINKTDINRIHFNLSENDEYVAHVPG